MLKTAEDAVWSSYLSNEQTGRGRKAVSLVGVGLGEELFEAGRRRR